MRDNAALLCSPRATRRVNAVFACSTPAEILAKSALAVDEDRPSRSIAASAFTDEDVSLSRSPEACLTSLDRTEMPRSAMGMDHLANIARNRAGVISGSFSGLAGSAISSSPPKIALSIAFRPA